MRQVNWAFGGLSVSLLIAAVVGGAVGCRRGREDADPRTGGAAKAAPALGAPAPEGADVPRRPPEPTRPSEVAERLQAAVVLLQTQHASGSGFVVLDRSGSLYVLTNHHVVAEVDAGKDARATFFAGGPEQWATRATVVAANPALDLALLRCRRSDRNPSPLEGSVQVSPLMPVIVAGFPFGERMGLEGNVPAPTLSRASISALRRGTLGGLELLQLDNQLNPGNSGGPVVNERGQVVGVSVAAVKGAGIGFVIPWERAWAFVDGRSAQLSARAPTVCDQGCTGEVSVSVVDPFHHVTQVELRLVEADGLFLSEPHSRPYRAEGMRLVRGLRPTSGALTLEAPVHFSRGRRYFFQVGYEVEGEMSYDLPVDVASVLERGAGDQSAGDEAAPDPSAPSGATGAELCKAMSGTFGRSDGLTISLRSNGCQISAVAENDTFFHDWKSTLDHATRVMNVSIRRFNKRTGCQTVMSGEVFVRDARSFTVAIHGSDGRCDLPAGFSESSLFHRL